MNGKLNILTLLIVSSMISSCLDDTYSNNTFFKNSSATDKQNLSQVAESIALHKNDYVAWIQDKKNGLAIEKEMGEFTFSTLFTPYEYLAILDMEKNTTTRKEIQDKVNEIDGLQYFTFRITAQNETTELLKVGINTPEEYAGRIEYCSFKMQNDIKLAEGSDTLDCILFHFERVYGIAPYATFALGFHKNNNSDSPSDKTLIYDDKMFNVGKINLTYKKENLSHIPSLLTD